MSSQSNKFDKDDFIASLIIVVLIFLITWGAVRAFLYINGIQIP